MLVMTRFIETYSCMLKSYWYEEVCEVSHYYFFLCILSSIFFFVPITIFAAQAKETPPKAVLTYHRAGLFSCFLVTLGMLDAYEQGRYSGVEVDFGTNGYYYDKLFGPNWWRYFFSSLNFGNEQAKKVIITTNIVNDFAKNAVGFLGRSRCKNLIDTYIKVRPEIIRCCQRFITKHFHDKAFIGVQYRGTDKFKHESTYVSVDDMCKKVAAIIEENEFATMPIFVATDTEEFLTQMKRKFGSRIVSYSTFYSIGSVPVHRRGDISGFRKGIEAVVDCLVLSRAHIFIHTASNLATAVSFFNPNLQCVLLNENLWLRALGLCTPLSRLHQNHIKYRSACSIPYVVTSTYPATSVYFQNISYKI